jgi:hypothetical protein
MLDCFSFNAIAESKVITTLAYYIQSTAQPTTLSYSQSTVHSFLSHPPAEVEFLDVNCNWDRSLESFPHCYTQSPVLTDLTPHPPTPSKSCLKLVCNVNIVYENLKSENSQDYAQKPQQNCMFMNSASGLIICLSSLPILTK